MTKSLFNLEGKNALVLGGGQGMGASISLKLAELGCNVAVLDLDADRAQRMADKISGKGPRGIGLRVDALDDADLQRTIREADELLGGLDAMATIVGAASWTPAIELTPEVWDQDQRRNLRYFFFAAQAAARCMVARGKPGSICGVSSISGARSSPYNASYGAAKAGVLNLVKTLAVEWAQHHIRVNAVIPGMIVTPRIPLRSPEEELKSVGMTPMKRRGVTDDIGNGLLFFMSAMSSYVTGQALAIDGGYLAAAPFDQELVMKGLPQGGTLGAAVSP